MENHIECYWHRALAAAQWVVKVLGSFDLEEGDDSVTLSWGVFLEGQWLELAVVRCSDSEDDQLWVNVCRSAIIHRGDLAELALMGAADVSNFKYMEYSRDIEPEKTPTIWPIPGSN